MITALRKGDKVVTAGGIRGTIQTVRDDSVVVKVDANTKLEFSKSAISNVLERPETKQDSDKPKMGSESSDQESSGSEDGAETE